jgi:hypothetical protein
MRSRPKMMQFPFGSVTPATRKRRRTLGIHFFRWESRAGEFGTARIEVVHAETQQGHARPIRS